MEWSPQQETTIFDVGSWLKDEKAKQVFKLFGFAGTGKTTLALFLAGLCKGKVLFAAFTGKAASVMRAKGCEGASTIHSLIYNPVETEFGSITWELNYESPIAVADLVIIDECSMVDEKLGRDLLSFGVKVLVLGDPAQLPPVGGQGFFTHLPNKTPCEPDVMLTEIHRQAADNPIIHMATIIRTGGKLEVGDYGSSKVITKAMLRDTYGDEVMKADQLIVGKNETRHGWNRRIREIKKLDPIKPARNEKLVCLKNYRAKGLLNGTLWNAEKVSRKGDSFNIWVQPIDMPLREKATAVKVRSEFFFGRESEISDGDRKHGDEFTYAYALTCHKSQGSQWDRTLIYDESAVFREDRAKWAYTAITRAAQSTIMVI